MPTTSKRGILKMIIGAPLELKSEERKIALTPSLVQTLISLGHKVLIQKNFGVGAGFIDEKFTQYGAEIIDSSEQIYSQSDIIVKINPPISDEYGLLKDKQIIFAFFNYSDKSSLMKVIREKKITTVSYSKIKNNQGFYPFIKASSEIVGKTVIRLASNIMEEYSGGALLSGATGVEPLKITVIGAGTVGFNAAKTAVSIGADVSILDINPFVLRNIENMPGRKIKTYFSNEENISKLLPDTDILICAVKRRNKQQKYIIKSKDIQYLKKGALVIDTGLVSGNGVVETLDRVLPRHNPIFCDNGILYYCFPDIASLAAKTISLAISGTLSNYLVSVATHDDIIDAL
ncbi:hypothetical protein IJG14_05450, partial [bacterium]|nr:hypothetical protein [bacterium]